MTGTILPTNKSLQATDAYARKLKGEQEKLGQTLDVLKNSSRKLVGGELRYYKTSTKYAVIGRDLKVKWFEVRKDGDYAIAVS